jgi:hypothetical protein
MTLATQKKAEQLARKAEQLNRMVYQRNEYRLIFERYMAQSAQVIKAFDNLKRNNPGKVWSRDSNLMARMETITNEFNTNLQNVVFNDIWGSWEKSQDATDKMVTEYIAGLSLTKTVTSGMFARNLSAYEGYLQRKNKLGFNISDRVWQIVVEARTQVDFYVSSGISTGRSAAGIASDLTTLLKEPDKVFHRVRNAKGDLVPSKPMKEYHPGQGVFRSSYKNALRLAATETNIAYNLADYDRWQSIPFVIGIEVHLSNNHPVFDICDWCAGIYSKDFIFVLWHPSCRCFAVPILMPIADFKRHIQGGIPFDVNSEHAKNLYMKGVAPGMTSWMSENTEMLGRMKSEPYWLTLNKEMLNL